MLAQVLEHVVHASATAEIDERLECPPLRIDPSAEYEDDEVALDLGGPSSLFDFGHRVLLGRRESSRTQVFEISPLHPARAPRVDSVRSA
jgi:hypothetical protein